MLKLTYSKKRRQSDHVTVLGDPAGIRDLYWQLTHNYAAQDGGEIDSIKVTNLDGYDCTKSIISTPHKWMTALSSIEK